MTNAKVYLAICEWHNAVEITRVLARAEDALGLSVSRSASVFIQPDCPWAHPRFAPAASTPAPMLAGIAKWLHGASLSVGACSLPGFPTRYTYKQLGYPALAKQYGFRLLAIDETRAHPATGSEKALPSAYLRAATRITLAKMRPSAYLSFAGAMKGLLGLLQPADQAAAHQSLPERLADLALAARPTLVIGEAIESGEEGFELSSKAAQVGVLLVGTDPAAIDAVWAAALGLDPNRIAFLRAAEKRGLGPIEIEHIQLLGEIGLDDLAKRVRRLKYPDPRPETFALPSHVRVLRNENSHLSGVAGSLSETLMILERSGISLKKAREAVLVLGETDEELIAQDDTAAVVLIGDGARACYRGYSRVVRLPGPFIPVRRLLDDLPFILRLSNPRDDFILPMTFDQIGATIGRWRAPRQAPDGA